ncbi:MAG: hypothetical protein U0136_01700 [Bdellovibrionota bacterium]
MIGKSHKRVEFIIRSSAWLMIAGFFFEFPVSKDAGQSTFDFAYHMLFALLTLAAGVGVLKRRPWSYHLVWVATVLVTIEEAVLILHPSTSPLPVLAAGVVPELNDLGTSFLRDITIASAIIVLTGWWGFAGYLAFRRDYFGAPGHE